MSRKLLTSVVEVVGMVLIVAGIATIDRTFALIAAGAFLILIGWLAA